MKLYRCTFVLKGRVKELFFRRGNNEQEIFEDLAFFRWGKGFWKIEEV